MSTAASSGLPVTREKHLEGARKRQEAEVLLASATWG